MESLEQIVHREDLSKKEQQIVEAYWPLMLELFSGMTPAVTDGVVQSPEFHRDIRRFLSMFIAIFRTTNVTVNSTTLDENGCKTPPDVQILEQCMEKFREVYRRYFRGVHYLTSGRLHEVFLLAEDKAVNLMKTFPLSVAEVEGKNKLLSRLRDIITQEGFWIEKVNTCKRMKIVDSIRMDTLGDFQTKVKREFGLLYGDSKTNFYEEGAFENRHAKMVMEVIDDFETQIPFRTDEDKAVMQETTSGFEMEVKEKVISDLIRRNVQNIKNVRAVMKHTVDRSVASYREKMASFVETMPLAHSNALLNHHTEMKDDCVPTFNPKIAKQNSGALELEVEFTNQFQQQIHESFGHVIEVGADKAKKILRQFQEKGQSKLDNFLQDLEKDFEGLEISPTYSNQLRDRMENVLTAVMADVKRSSLADVETVDVLLGVSTPTVILTPAYILKRDQEIQAFLGERKHEYIRTLEPLLNATRNCEVAQDHHENVKRELTKQLKMTLIGKFGLDETCGDYISDFHAFTDEHWQQKHAEFSK